MKINTDSRHEQRPLLAYLSQEKKERIHHASLEVLERTGMDFNSPEAIDILSASGARVVDGNRVKIPSSLVDEALASVPKSVVLNDRDGRKALFLERNNVYYGPGSETPFTLDPYTGERRPSLKEDVVKAARVVDYLPNIDFVMSFALATDIPKRCEDVHHFEAMVRTTTKPVLFTSWDLDGIQSIYEICVTVRGSDEAFKADPFICHYVEPISPLKHPRESIDKLFFSVDHGIPVMYVPAPSAGGTAPVTLAGAFALSNAEVLSGLVLAQLKKKGAPFVYGGGPNLLDPRTAVFSYGAPETFISRIVRTEMAHFYGLPAFSTGGCTDAKTLDQQAAFEAGNSLILSSLAGSDLVHDVGYMESGFTSSLTLLTLCDEMIGSARRVLRGFDVSEEKLAVHVIDSVGPGGNFLSLEHTLKHFKEEIWMSQISDRQDYKGWKNGGSKTFKDKAEEKLRWILENHRPRPLKDSVQSQVSEIVKDLDARRQRSSP